jgi:hypothetical protein
MEYLLADLFKEDTRFIPRSSPNLPAPDSKLKAALKDTFLARCGDDGRAVFSVARLLGPLAGSAIAVKARYPSGYGGTEIAREAGVRYTFQFLKTICER